MSSAIKLVGPGLVFLIVLGVVVWVLSACVVIDALRRRRSDYAGVPEGRFFYAVPQAVFFCAFLAWQVSAARTLLPWVGDVVLTLPLMLVIQVAYLLRVVFPTAARLEARLAAEGVQSPEK